MDRTAERNLSFLLLAGAVVAVGVLLSRKGSAAGCLDDNMSPELKDAARGYLASKAVHQTPAQIEETARAAALNNHPRYAACIRKLAAERGAQGG